VPESQKRHNNSTEQWGMSLWFINSSGVEQRALVVAPKTVPQRRSQDSGAHGSSSANLQ